MPREWGIPESFATYHTVDSEESLEAFIKDSSLNKEEIEELREDFADQDVGGKAYADKGLVVIFTNKEYVRENIGEVIAHESSHIAYKDITPEENKTFNNAILAYLRSRKGGDEFVKELQDAYHPDGWANEVMAYSYDSVVEKLGIEKIKSGKIKFRGEEINNFVRRITNIIFNGKDNTGKPNQPNETNRRDNRQGQAEREETGSDIRSDEGRRGGSERASRSGRGEGGRVPEVKGSIRFRVDDFSPRDRVIG